MRQVLLMMIGVLIGFAAHAVEQMEIEHSPPPPPGLPSGSASAVTGSGSVSVVGCGQGSVDGSGSSAHNDLWWDPKGDFVIGVRTIGTMDPHVLLYVFLPALLFESANGVGTTCMTPDGIPSLSCVTS